MKKVDCEHWSDRRVVGGGACALGKFGGRPSLGTCDFCQGKVPRPPDPELAKVFAVQVNVPDRRATEGPKRWAALHRRALAWDGTNPESEMDFIRKLADGLGLCSCKRDWAELLPVIPPDLTSAEAYWVWSYNMHRAINDKLKKPTPTLEEARAKWAGSP